MVNMPHMLKYEGPRGLYLNIKGLLFLETKAATCLRFFMVIGFDYPHTHNGPSIHNANMWPAYACLFQHQRYMGGLVQA